MSDGAAATNQSNEIAESSIYSSGDNVNGVVVEAALALAGNTITSWADPKTCKHRFIEREIFECEHCTRAFTTAYNLNRHKKGNCHENICAKCNLRFQTTEELKEHNLTCTGL